MVDIFQTLRLIEENILVLEPKCEIFIIGIRKLNTTKYVVLCSAAYNNIISIVNPQNGH